MHFRIQIESVKLKGVIVYAVCLYCANSLRMRAIILLLVKRAWPVLAQG